MTTIVSGNMRCGSSLVMRMLGAGGLPLYYDQPDSFEHTGYLRYVRDRDAQWLYGAEGKAVKWLDPLLHCFPPRDRKYRIVTLTRDAAQQHRSQVKFLRLLGGPVLPESRVARRMLARDNAKLASAWAPYGDVLPLTFEAILADPLGVAAELRDFCGLADERPMAAQVIRRGPGCLPDLLEARFDDYPLWNPA